MSDWVLPGRFGAERWRLDGGVPVAVGIDGVAVPDPADASLLDRIGARDTACGHAGPLPNGFRFCPECGAPLIDAPSPDGSAPWSPPFGGADGLPDGHASGRPVTDTREEIRMPDSPAIGLAVAGTPSRLLCCDRSNGWVSAFSERDRAWHRLLRVPGCAALPRRSWSAVATTRGLALPTERGPVWIALTGAIGAPTASCAEPCAPAGGPARIGEKVLAPVWRHDALCIATLFPGDTDWVLAPVAGAQSCGTSPLSSPVCASETAFWFNSSGQLVVRDTPDGLEARFAAWSDGVSPLLDTRPVMARDGTLHLPARLDRDTLVHETLCLFGQPRGRRIARGYAPGTGRAVFRENTRLRVPWDDRAACEYPLPDNHFLHPLLHLGGDRFVLAVCEDRARLGGFLGDPSFADASEASPLRCTLMYSRGPRMLEPLDCVLRANRASDLSAVIWNGWLLVHGASDNRCHRWALRDEA